MEKCYKISGLLLMIFLLHACKKEDDNSIKDYDGNVYTSVKIGTQTWMVENLLTTHYKNGSEIPAVTTFTAWGNLSTPGYCWYNDDETANKTNYGALYNWFAVSTGNLCPAGWHVPSSEEWNLLSTYLGGDNASGGKLKEAGTRHWSSPNTGATNESGFTALPGGQRDDAGAFYFTGTVGFWWSNTAAYADRAFSRELDNDYTTFFPFNDIKKFGFSVRCIKD
jgi:uncharacterized protein (TIGR02145 family)